MLYTIGELDQPVVQIVDESGSGTGTECSDRYGGYAWLVLGRGDQPITLDAG